MSEKIFERLNDASGVYFEGRLIERRRTPLEHLLARALSMSSLSRQRLGARLDELLEKIEQLVKPHVRDGHVDETVESSALIARRPMS